MRPLRLLPILVLTLVLTVSGAARAEAPIETADLADLVKARKLPPVAERLPRVPRRVDLKSMGREPGRHGGELRMLMGDVKDLRQMVVYGYSRLVCYSEKLELEADILESFEVKDDRVFTFKLRPGHRWSDGHPFTTEDFRYFWEDVALNKKLSPGGPPVEMMVAGEKPVVEVIDPTTIRYSWSKPNPNFLSTLAGARPLYIYMPSHYLKQFHASHVQAEKLDALVKKREMQNWARLHERESRMYRPENPKLPSLDPWVPTTKPPSTRFEFARNPYFHRVDEAGRQLPYIGKVVITIVSNQLIPAKVASGESDLQARYIRFDNYTFLKEAERRGLIKVKLWQRGEGSTLAMMPNLNTVHDGWRTAFRDVRVRRALSLGIDRREINMAIFYGLAEASANTVIPRSPLFKPEYASAWSRFDVKEANRLLDEAGFSKPGFDGVRRLPGGERAEIIVETAGENSQEADVLGLIRDSWLKVGIKIYPRPTQRDLLRKRVLSGDTIMSVWSGFDDATPTADRMPSEFTPTLSDQLQWPKWGQHYESMGASGVKPDMLEVARLMELLGNWRLAKDRSEREQIWTEILKLHSDQVFTIGTINQSLQPIVVNRLLRNVPDKGFFAFEPGGYFGLYKPDTFWLDIATQ